MGNKISKNQRVGAGDSKPRGRTIHKYGAPLCGFCTKGTRRTKPKWSVCENGHKLYKNKTRTKVK